MKLSAFHHHLLKAAKEQGISPEEEYRRAYEMGFAAVDINLDDLLKDPTLPARLAEAGLGFSSVHAYYKFSERDESARIKLHMETAAACKAPCVMVIPDFYPTGEIPASVIHDPAACAAFFDASARMEKILSGMREAVRVGQAHGIAVTVEDYDHADSPTATSTEIAYFLARVPGLAVTFDTGNFAFSDEDTAAAYEALAPYTVNLHCKDRGKDSQNRGKHTQGLAPCAVGDGYLPLAAILAALKAADYRGYLTVEHFGVKNFTDALARSLAFLSAQIA